LNLPENTRPRIGLRVGLLGGSFDPVHVAHIALAKTALAELNLDAVQLIPAAAPWQRAPLAASAQQRLDMLALAIDGIDGLSVNDIELQRGGPTYTIDTVRALPDDTRHFWLLGADQLQNFCTWRNWPHIVEHVELAVASRPGVPVAAPPALAAQLTRLGRTLHRLPFAEQSVSASAIRAHLARGEPVTHLVAPAVLAYIQAHHLYRTP